MGSVFFRTLFEISSGPGALSDARRLIASHICRIVIYASYGISYGYFVERMSVRSAGDDLGKKAFLNTLTFYSFIAACSLRVDINIDIEIFMIYFLI